MSDQLALNSFTVGDYVRIHPAADAFMRGVTHGTITVVGRKWLHVRWSMNAAIVVKVRPRDVLEVVND